MTQPFINLIKQATRQPQFWFILGISAVFFASLIILKDKSTTAPIPYHPYPYQGTVEQANIPRHNEVPFTQNTISPIPILEYHHIRDYNYHPNDPEYYISVSPAVFKSQMALLHQLGFQTITFTDYISGKFNHKSIIMTFDDGYADNYTQAYPVLKQYNFKGVFYLISGFIGQQDYLNPAQVKEMASNGMVIGSHTVNHMDLTKIPEADALNELKNSKADLETLLSSSVEDFCFPFGGYTLRLADLARQVGYQTAVTTAKPIRGNFQSDFSLPRIPVINTSTPVSLIHQINVVENEGLNTSYRRSISPRLH